MWMFCNNLFPIISYIKPNNSVADIFHALRLAGVTFLARSKLMVWAIHINGNTILFIQEIRSCVAALDKFLRMGGQGQVALLHEIQPLMLKVGLAQVVQAFQMFLAR